MVKCGEDTMRVIDSFEAGIRRTTENRELWALGRHLTVPVGCRMQPKAGIATVHDGLEAARS